MYLIAILLLFGVVSASAQQLALKETFHRDGQLLMFIANMDNDPAPEYVVMIDSTATIAIIDGRTRITEYTVPLDIANNENLYTDDQVSLRLRNLMLVQDFNGNGVKDLMITGGDAEPYFRIVDPKSGEDLLKIDLPIGDRQVEVMDIDGDNYYELIISGGFLTNIYATQARISEANDVQGKNLTSNLVVYPNFPNPVSTGTTLAWEQPTAAEATVSVYDERGELIRHVFQGIAQEGLNLCEWNGYENNGKIAPSGTYQIKVQTQGKTVGGTLQIVR